MNMCSRLLGVADPAPDRLRARLTLDDNNYNNVFIFMMIIMIMMILFLLSLVAERPPRASLCVCALAAAQTPEGTNGVPRNGGRK